MKKIKLGIMLAMLLASFSVSSQDSTKVLFHLSKIPVSTIGLYVAPEYQYGQLKNQFTSFGGVSGMILFNNKFGIGASMQHSLNQSFSPTGISPLYLKASVSGLKLEYVFYAQKQFHFTTNLFLGGGFARADSITSFRDNNGSIYPSEGRDGNFLRDSLGIHSNFFIIQPGITAEANLFKYVKAYAGVNYRFALKGTESNSLLPTSTMEGLSINVGLKIGLFEHKLHKKDLQ